MKKIFLFSILLLFLLLPLNVAADGDSEGFATECGIVLDGYEMLSASQKAAFDRVFEDATEGYTVSPSQEAVDAWLSAASSMRYLGLAARIAGEGMGIRSQYAVDMDALSVLASRYRVTVGAIMAIGELNGETLREADGLTVEKDATRGYVASGSSASAVVVYDSDGADYASYLFNTASVSGERVFSYTTVYSEGWQNKTAYATIGLVYRGFLVLTVDETEYVFYFDQLGDLFGNENATYGKSTTLAELATYFTTVYTDVNGTLLYAKNEKLRTVVTETLTTDFTVTADQMTVFGSARKYAADEAAGTRASVVSPIGTGNGLRFTVEAARAGFYTVSFDMNTLGGYLHYLSLYNESLGKSAEGNSLALLRNDARIGASANATLNASYATYFSSLYGVSVSTDDVLKLAKKTYTYGDAAVNPGNEAFRVVSSVPELYAAQTTVYLAEGKNTLKLSARSESSDTRIAAAFGMAAVTLELSKSVDPDFGSLLFAYDAHTKNGTGGYAFGDDGVNSSGIFVESEYLEKATAGHNASDGMMLRISGYTHTKASGNYLTLPLTVERDGVYCPSLLYSGGGGSFTVSENGTTLYTAGLAQKNSVGGNANGLSLTVLGEIALEAGKTYSVKVRMTGSNYLSVSLIDFSYLRDSATVTAPPETEFTYPVTDTQHVKLSSTVYQNGSTTTVILSQGHTMTVTVPCELSGLYRVHVNGKTNGEARIGYITLKNTTTSYAAWKNRVTEARVAANAADATGGLRDIDVGYQYLSAGENNKISIALTTAESPLTLDSVSFTYVGGDAEAATSESVFVSANETTTFVGTTRNGVVCEAQKATQGLFFNQNVSTVKAGFGVHTFTNKLSLTGGTYRVYPLFTYCNSESNLAKIGFSLTDEDGGVYQKTLQSWKNSGHTVKELQPFSSTAVAAFDFGTWTLSAGDYTLKVFNEYNGVEYFAGLWLVRIPDHTLTVHYVDENGNSLAPDAALYLKNGEDYAVTSPKIDGHTPNISVLEGTATADREVTVVYTAKRYGMRVDYVLPDGTPAAPSYSTTLSYGSEYEIASPVLSGYVASTETLSGICTSPMLVKVRYTPATYTVTVNYLDASGNSVADSVTLSGAYGECYELVSPTVDGYGYCTHPTLTGGFDHDDVRNVYYARSDGYTFTADDMTLKGSAALVTPSDTDTTKSVYIPGSSDPASPSNYAEMKASAAIAGVYKVDFIYNSNNYLVNYLYFRNVSSGEAIYANCRLKNNGSYAKDASAENFAVTADMAASDCNNTESVYVYLKNGDNTLRLYAHNTDTHLAVHTVKLTLVSALPEAARVQTTKASIAKDASGNSMANSTEGNYCANGMMLRSQYAVWKVTVAKDGIYDVSALLARENSSVTLTHLGQDGKTVGETLTSGSASQMSGSSSAAKYVTLGKFALTAGTNYIRVTGTGGWIMMESLFFAPAETHDVTVRYLYADGKTAFDTKTVRVALGGTYEIPSPTLLGYTVSDEAVAGKMGHASVMKTVVYTLDPACVTGDDGIATFSYNGETVTVTASSESPQAARSLFVLPNCVLRNDADTAVSVTLTHGTKETRVVLAAGEEWRYGNALCINGVDVWYYRIVYAESELDKWIGSLTGLTVYEDIGEFLQGSEKNADFDYQTAMRLRDLIGEYCGILPEVVKDTATPESEYEILVGSTNRTESKAASALGVDDFICKAFGDKYAIAGGAYGSTWHAVDQWEAAFATAEGDLEMTALSDLSGSYALFKVASCGDSITRGSQALPDGSFATSESIVKRFGGTATSIYFEQYLSYPAVLGRENWKDHVVYNFGHGGATMLDLNETSGWSYYYRGVQKYANCLAMSNDEDFAFDLVLIMLGTNDGSVTGDWNEARRAEYLSEARTLLDEIKAGSPDATFVLMNVPHVCSVGSHVRPTVRAVQKETAQSLKDEGYNIYHYDMGSYMRDNLTSDLSLEGIDNATEHAIHRDYYNLDNEAGTPDTLHPNYRGYGKIAEGVDKILAYLLENAEKPSYMIDLE